MQPVHSYLVHAQNTMQLFTWQLDSMGVVHNNMDWFSCPTSV